MTLSSLRIKILALASALACASGSAPKSRIIPIVPAQSICEQCMPPVVTQTPNHISVPWYYASGAMPPKASL